MKKNFLKYVLLLIVAVTSVNLSAQYKVVLDEDFEDITTGVPSGWDNSGSDVSTSYRWQYVQKDGQKCLDFDARSSVGTESVLKTPPIIMPFSEMYLSFDYIKEPLCGDFSVYISTDGGKTYIDNLLLKDLDVVDEWTNIEVGLEDYRDMSNVMVVFVAQSSDEYDYAFLDNVKIQTKPLCAAPIDIYVNQVTQTSAMLNWSLSQFGTIPSSYILEVKDEDDNVIIANNNVPAGQSVQLNSLNAKTTYRVLLQSNCTDNYKGMSAYSNSFSFSTLCSTLSLPLSYDFKSETEPLPVCWIPGGGNMEDVMLVSSTAVEPNGDQSICLKSKTDKDVFIATPQINHDADDMEISFKMYGSKHAKFNVALIKDVADASSAVIVASDSLDEANQWYEFVVNTASIPYYKGEKGLHVYFYLPSGYDKTIHIDDITITEIPSCVRPDNLIVSDITETGATFSWNTQKGQNANKFQLKFVSGTSQNIIDVNGAKTYTHTALNSNTEYKVYVRQICSAADTSAWISKPLIFKTFCAPITSYPFVESFEADGWLYSCWYREHLQVGNGSITVDWGASAWNVTDDPQGDGPDEAYDGNNVLEVKQTNSGTRTLLALPYMNVTSATSHEVSFFMYRGKPFNGQLAEGINVWVNDQQTLDGGIKLGFISHRFEGEPVEMQEGWYKYTFPVAMEGNVFVMFESISRGGAETYIDYVEVRERPNCVPVVRVNLDSISTNSAFFSWDVEPNKANEWSVSYQTSEMLEAIIDTVQTTNYTITGLQPNTNYGVSVTVTSLCGEGNISEGKTWSDYVYTECLPTPFPYREDFEGTFNPDRINCWTFPYTYKVSTLTYPRHFKSETMQLETERFNVLVSPEIGIDTWAGKRIYVDAYGKNPPVRVAIAVDPYDTTTYTMLQTLDIVGVKKTFTIDLTQDYPGRHIAFLTGNDDAYDANNSFDNIKVDNIPVCPDITNYSVGVVLQTSIDISIADEVNTTWEAQYSVAPFNENTATTVQITSLKQTISGLTPDTHYDIRLRSVCNTNDKGNWADMQNFKTMCDAYVVTDTDPFFEGFESGFVNGEIINGCWIQEAVSGYATEMWMANSSILANGRAPYEGTFNAIIGYRDNKDYIVYALNLTENTNYKFSCFARTGAIKAAAKRNVDVKLCSHIDESDENMAIIDNTEIPIGESYTQFSNYFAVPESGIYFLKVGTDKSFYGNNYVALDNIKVEEVLCAPPAEAVTVVTNLTNNEVEIQWTNPSNRFVFKLDSESIDPTVDVASLFNDTLSVAQLLQTNLLPNTTYYYYIQSICSNGGTSDWSAEATFTTHCDPFVLPYIETFDNNGGEFACWKSLGEVDPVLTAEKKLSGSNSIKCSAVTIASPTLNTTSLVDKQLSAFVYSESDMAKLSIGVMTDINDMNTYELISEIQITEKNKWIEIISYFDILTDPDYVDYAGAKNIVITVSEDYQIYIDNIEIADVPSCPKPSMLSITDVAHNAATIAWEDNGNTSWHIRLLNGDKVAKDEVLSSNVVTYTDLKDITNYEVQVRVICAVGDTSGISSATFRTICLPEVDVPFIETFNHLATGKYIDCWENTWMSVHDKDNSWRAYTGSKTPTVSYEFNSYSTANNGEWSVLETPIVDLTGISLATLSFEAMNAYGGEFTVLISKDAGVYYPDTLLFNVQNVSSLKYYEFDISEYTGHKIRVAFKGVSNGSKDKEAYIRIDNINIYEASSCYAPQGIEPIHVSNDSVQVLIHDETGGTQWEVALVPVGNDVEDYPITLTNSNVVKFYDVNPATNYVVYARRACGEERSRWIISETITTPCDKLVLPYVQNFNSVNNIVDIQCINSIGFDLGASRPGMDIISTASTTFDGSNYLRMSPSNGAYIYYVFPETEMPIDSITVRFKHRKGSTSFNYSELEVGVIPLSLATSEFKVAKTVDATNVYANKEVQMANAGVKGNDYRIAFRVLGVSNYDYLYVDDIEISRRDNCIAPGGVEVQEVGGDSVVLNIKDAANTEWELAYGKVGVLFEDLTRIEDLTNPICTLKGLESATNYQVYVRATCAGTNTEWSQCNVIATDCSVYEINETKSYAENFSALQQGDRPSCWNVMQSHVGNSNIYPMIDKTDNTLTLNLFDGAQAIALPKFSVPVNRLYLDIEAKCTYPSQGTGKFYVAYATDISSMSSITNLYELNVPQNKETFSLDLTMCPPEAEYIVLRTMVFHDIIVSKVDVRLAPECFTPSVNATYIENITHSSVDVRFVVAPHHSSMEYKLFKNNVQEQTAWSANTSINITSLEENTEYAIVYRSACDDNGALDTTEWGDTVYFKTHQAPAALPYECNFEETTENDNWMFTGNGDNKWIISNNDNAAVRQGVNAMYISDNDSANNYNAITASNSWAYRTFNLDAGIYNLSYFYKVTGDVQDYMRVVLVPASESINGTTAVNSTMVVADGGMKVYNKPTWTKCDMNVAVEESGYYNLAFAWINNNKDAYQRPATVDSIALSRVDCAPLLDAQIVSVSATSVTLDLNDYSATNVEYQVVVKDNASAISLIDIQNAQIFTEDNVTLINLLPSTQYSVYARSVCAVGDTTEWTDAIHVSTTCVPDTINAYRSFVESFENYETQNSPIDGCWIQESLNEPIFSADYESWLLTFDNTLYYYGTEPRTGVNSAFLYYGNHDLLKRSIYLHGGEEYTFSLYARQNEANKHLANVEIGVEYMVGGDRVYQPVVYEDITNGEYQRVKGLFTPPADGEYTLVIGSTIVTPALLLTIDDISVSMNLCSTPTNVEITDVASSSAKIKWSVSTGEKTNIKIYGGAEMIDTTVNCEVGENIFIVEDINPATDYTVEVVNKCGENIGEVVTTNFVTLCDIVNLPYVNNFQSLQDDATPICWDNTAGTSSSYFTWKVVSEGENKFLRFNSILNPKYSKGVLKTVQINIDDVDYSLSFDYKNPAGGAMSVHISTDGGTTYAETILDKVMNVKDWTTLVKPLSAYSGQLVTVVFESTSNKAEKGDAYHYLDNFKVDKNGGVVEHHATICANTPYSNYGFMIDATETTNAGVYELVRLQTAKNSAEKDSTIILNLTVDAVYENIIYDTFCEGQIYDKGYFSGISEVGTYVANLQSKTGCDSLVVLYLDALDLDSTYIETICEGDTVEFFGKYYTESNTYTHTETVNECLSVKTLILTVLPKQYVTVEHICEGDTISFEGSEYTETGVYTHVYENHLGCDSIMVLDLIVHGLGSTLDTVICEGQSILFNGDNLDSTGVYSFTYNNEWGCDSTAVLKLTVTAADTIVVKDYVCEGREYFGNGIAALTISNDTIVYSRGQSIEGCDSVIEIHLRLSLTEEVYDTVKISNGDTYEFGGSDLTTAGDYDHNFANAEGCDSIVYLHLIVGGVNVENLYEQSLTIAPNPISKFEQAIIYNDWTDAEKDGMKIEIIDAVGRIVYIYAADVFPVTVNSIGVVGVYYIRITTGTGEVHVGKLVVK